MHLLGTLYLCALIIRDALVPERDPVRKEGADDPGGGVLDRAPDAFVLGRARRASRYDGAALVDWGVHRE